jgi:tetratricopeptide (TPR) repeat protein
MLPIERQRLTQKIRQLCAEGYQRYDADDYQSALRLFYQAWLVLPKPQTDWPEAGWVLTAIGDAYFRLGRYRPGCEALSSALCCPGMAHAPFTYIRLGQCLRELGGEEEGRTALIRAYQLAQMDIFEGENEKYRHAISDLVPAE